jgi:Family of unknown function (DUF6127)
LDIEMTDSILTHLTKQAEERGADLSTLRALVEDASECGTTAALKRLGLDDPSAQKDMAELRELLSAWRDAKASARKAIVDWVVRGMLALLLIGIAVKMGLAGLVSQ